MDLKPLDVSKLINVKRIHSMDEVNSTLMPWLYLQTELGWDIETTFTKEFFERKTRTIQFGTKEKQFIIDLLDFTDNNPALLAQCQGWYGMNLFGAPKLQALLKRLEPILCSDKWLKVGVNLGFEFTQFYWGFGMMPWHLYGCDIVERVKVAGAHSLEDYGYFSMEEMMARYYEVSIDKTLQQSFDISTPLTQSQINYAVLDTRLPLAIRHRQLHGWNRENGTHVAGVIEEGLLRTCELENDCIMSFEMMHVHGEKIDTASWIKRIDGLVVEHKAALNQLDQLMIPIVGEKSQVVTDAMVNEADAKWKAIKDTKDPARIKLKAMASDLGKARTWGKKMLESIQGEALINYNSPSQLLKILKTKFAGLQKLKGTDDDDMKGFEGIPVIDALRKYRGLEKQISTYGYAWAKEWVTKPCNEEGWLSPYTHKLHSRFNQLAAETGRSSSDKPNGQNLLRAKSVRQAFIAEDGNVYVTADMSGAELRIIAELANAKTWIEAFARGEDLHSVGCEILFPKEWPTEQCTGEEIKIKGKMVPYFCEYYKLNDKGVPAHAKCECPKHKARREVTKAINFLLAYGGIAATLAARTGMSKEDAESVMGVHAEKFPDIHAYLEKSGKQAVRFFKSFDMYGRRRLFPVPTEERGRNKIIEYWKDSIKLPEEIAAKNVQQWKEAHKIVVTDKKGNEKIKYIAPIGDVKFWLTHREPNAKEIQKAVRSMLQGIERAGKNHSIQGTNASIAKIAMGAGFDKNGKPYLFHILPKLKAKLVKFVHDELVVTCPPEQANEVAFEIGDAFKRAAAEVMHKVVMEFEFKVAPFWDK